MNVSQICNEIRNFQDDKSCNKINQESRNVKIMAIPNQKMFQ